MPGRVSYTGNCQSCGDFSVLHSADYAREAERRMRRWLCATCLSGYRRLTLFDIFFSWVFRVVCPPIT